MQQQTLIEKMMTKGSENTTEDVWCQFQTEKQNRELKHSAPKNKLKVCLDAEEMRI